MVKDYFSKSYTIISTLYNSYDNRDKLLNYVKKADIKFSKIDLSNKRLFILVFNGNYYEINKDNISCILSSKNLISEYNKASYTAILKTKKRNLISYIENNLSHCIKNIFPNTSTEEDIYSIKRIINNIDLEHKVKLDYLLKQNLRLIALDDIDEGQYQFLLKNGLITISWKLILDYFNVFKIDDIILDSIEENIDNLGLCTNDEIGENNVEKLYENLIVSNAIKNIDLYKSVCEKFNINFTDCDFSEIDESKVRHLINIKKIKYNDYYTKHINELPSQLMGDYLITNIKEYIKGVGSVSISSDTLKEILNTNNIILSDKLTVINSVDDWLLYESEGMANVVIDILANSSEIKLKNEVLQSLIETAIDQSLKLKYVITIFEHKEYDEELVTNLLMSLGGEYAKIPKKEHMAKFNSDKNHLIIAEYLWKNKYYSISSKPVTKKEYIYIYMKRS